MGERWALALEVVVMPLSLRVMGGSWVGPALHGRRPMPKMLAMLWQQLSWLPQFEWLALLRQPGCLPLLYGLRREHLRDLHFHVGLESLLPHDEENSPAPLHHV